MRSYKLRIFWIFTRDTSTVLQEGLWKHIPPMLIVLVICQCLLSLPANPSHMPPPLPPPLSTHSLMVSDVPLARQLNAKIFELVSFLFLRSIALLLCV